MSEATANVQTSAGTSPQTGSQTRGTDVRPSAGVAESITGANTKTGKDGRTTPEQEVAKEKAEAKRYKFEKLKFKGKEIDFEGDEEQIKRVIQQGLGAGDRYQEAKQLRDEAERKFAEYQKWQATQKETEQQLLMNPIQAAIARGATKQQVREVAEKWLLEQIQEDDMSPDAKRALAAEQELERLRQEHEKKIQDEQEAQLSRAAEEQRKVIVPEIMKHMDATGLAKTAANLSAVARRLQAAAKQKRPMTVERAVQLQFEDNQVLVKSTLGGQIGALNQAFKSNDTESVLRIGREIESFLGNDALVALQRYGIVKYRNKIPNMPSQTFESARRNETKSEERVMTPDDAAEERRKRVEALQAEWERNNRGAAS